MLESVISNHSLYRILSNRIGLRGKRRMIRWINHYRRIRLRHLSFPESIVFFVTNHCQMKCVFCFYKNRLNNGNCLIRIKEIESIAKSIPRLSRITLTGGEPFLRNDLAQIAYAFYRFSRARSISIDTNGYLTQEILAIVKRILCKEHSRYLKVQVSIDELDEKHDQLRGTRGAFDRATATLKALTELQKQHRNLYVEIATLVTSHLIADVEEFVQHFNEYQIPIKFCVIRNSAMNAFQLPAIVASNFVAETNPIFPEEASLKSFFGKLLELNKKAKFKFWSTFQQVKTEKVLQILQTKKKALPCYAGKVDAVIYHDGSVGCCENTRPFANLKDYDFNFERLWEFSKHHNDFDGQVEGCSCIHGCNLVTALSYDEETLSRILG
jgi:MoaA/NifB/PqqE/SkfB family radical SAM enzyme